MTDKYASYAQLEAEEEQGQDFSRTYTDRGSEILVLAPHAGGIEPGTSRIARAIAGDDWSLYLFEGLKSTGNCKLHITSRRFDEPTAVAAVEDARLVVSVHGERTTDEEFVEVGGLYSELRTRVKDRLDEAGFPVRRPPERRAGTNPKNICNRGKERGGIQLEVSRKLRDTLSEDQDRLNEFARSVRAELMHWLQRQGRA